MGKELLSMSGEGRVIHGVDWQQTFPFIQIFNSFRVAIHLSKLALGLALLLSVWIGGAVLDGIWFHSARALPGEIGAYSQIASNDSGQSLTQWRDETRSQIEATYAGMLEDYGVITPGDNEAPADEYQRALDTAKKGDSLGDLEKKIAERRDAAVKQADSDYDTAVRSADSRNLDQVKHDAATARDEAKMAAFDRARADEEQAQEINGEGLFSAFFGYEIHQVYLVVQAVAHNNWVAPDGAVEHLFNFFTVGPVWLIFHHTIFFVFFGLWFLLIWALFGGAISRIAAVQVARDEKISIRQAMNFAVGKLLSFGSAPVIPVAIVLAIGLILAAAALLGNIPFVGPIAIGACFAFALLAGFVMTLVLLGTAGGFNLMYPTIAVEGSDSFDAISRSFSYVYARPWRMLFYSLVALVYGAATYIFVHCFIYIMLVLAHHFVGMGIFTRAADSRDLLSVMWPSPVTTGRVAYSVHYDALGPGQSLGAFFIHIWVSLLVSFLGSFAISLYFSANTIIYYLMRQEVDSTEMDDVYLEQSPDDQDPSMPMGMEPVHVSAAVTVISATAEPPAEEPKDLPPPAAPEPPNETPASS